MKEEEAVHLAPLQGELAREAGLRGLTPGRQIHHDRYGRRDIICGIYRQRKTDQIDLGTAGNSQRKRYIMIIYRLEKGTEVSESEKALLERAKTLLVVYDEDSPEMTDEMEKAFIAARKKKPYKDTSSVVSA